jgi:hypothetical protein
VLLSVLVVCAAIRWKGRWRLAAVVPILPTLGCWLKAVVDGVEYQGSGQSGDPLRVSGRRGELGDGEGAPEARPRRSSPG